MFAKIIGFDEFSFTDKNTGEVIVGKKVYYEIVPEEDEENTAQYGNSVSSAFFKNCIPISVGSVYGVSLKAKKTDEGILYKPNGLYNIK